jgi:WD40 repeat protein
LIAITDAAWDSPRSRVQFWAGKSPKVLATFDDCAGAEPVCSPDGKWGVYGTDGGAVKVFNVKKKAIQHTLHGTGDRVDALAFSPNSKTVVSGGADKIVRFWDVETGKPLGALVLLTDGQWLAVSPEGYYRASSRAAGKFYFVVEPEGETARNMKPAEFTEKYSWRNDPMKFRLVAR